MIEAKPMSSLCKKSQEILREYLQGQKDSAIAKFGPRGEAIQVAGMVVENLVVLPKLLEAKDGDETMGMIASQYLRHAALGACTMLSINLGCTFEEAHTLIDDWNMGYVRAKEAAVAMDVLERNGTAFGLALNPFTDYFREIVGKSDEEVDASDPFDIQFVQPESPLIH